VKRTAASNERRRSGASSSGGEHAKDAEDFRDGLARDWKSRNKTAQTMQKTPTATC
jgi:hypothetical protein